LIIARYLKHRGGLTREALARLVDEDAPEPDTTAVQHDAEEAAIEQPLSLHQQRLGAVLATLKNSGAQRVLDLGCGEGRLLALLLKESQFTRIRGMDVSYRVLERAAERLRLDRLPPKKRERIDLIQGSLLYRDPRLDGFEAAAVVEVIEHFDPPRLAAFERVLFGFARPETVVITTPNREYNVMWDSLPAGKFRHRDHRFEWTRAEFQTWGHDLAENFGYRVRFLPVGPAAANVGAPSQMGVFERIQ
jgi:3' terminal RNA ribose 2'-O-methyltransferase Hen1